MAWTVWQGSGGKWVRKEVVGREVVKVKEVELAAAEEEIRKRKQEEKGTLEELKEELRRWRLELGDKDRRWQGRRDFLWKKWKRVHMRIR